MTDFLTKKIWTLGCLFLVVLGLPSVVDGQSTSTPCCSYNNTACLTIANVPAGTPLPNSWETCYARNPNATFITHTWYPNGLIANAAGCVAKFQPCTTSANCCGSAICDSTATSATRLCRDVGQTCNAFNQTFCNGRSACRWSGTECIASFNATIWGNTTALRMKPSSTCCSQDYRSCSTSLTTFADCIARGGSNASWYDRGLPTNACTRLNSACTSNDQCCGTSMCEGDFANPISKTCKAPTIACASFNTSSYCGSRSACMWNGARCVPTYNATFFAPQAKPTLLAEPISCCSRNNSDCVFPNPGTYEGCLALNNTWFPDGIPNPPLPFGTTTTTNATTCLRRWTMCTNNTQCCGNSICETAYGGSTLYCRDPTIGCRAFNYSTYCNSKSACTWSELDNVCRPTHNTTHFFANDKPPSYPPAPSCCSLNSKHCMTGPTAPTTYDECKVIPNAIWYDTNLPVYSASWLARGDKCTTNEKCPGNTICEGTYTSPDDGYCKDPIPACLTFNTSKFCTSRAACEWDTASATCKPDPLFNTSFHFPPGSFPGKPESLPMIRPCCSTDHKTCKKRYLVTPEECKADDPTAVFRSLGEAQTTCIDRNSNLDCAKNSDCCGNLVCAPEGFMPFLKCRHPMEICPRFTIRGVAKCNQIPGCKWSGLFCGPSFDTSVLDPAVRATIPEPSPLLTALQGNPDSLGECTGFVGSIYGDPHISSFDRRTYDCMGKGTYTLVKAKGLLNIQGLFDQIGRRAASVNRGVAISYPMLCDVPEIQISITNDTGAYPISEKCHANVYMDGVIASVRRNFHLFNDGSYAMIFNTDGSVDIQYFNISTSPPTPITAIRIEVGGDPKQKLGCMLNVWICVGLEDVELRKNIVGLLGTPNANRTDEWKNEKGVILPIKPGSNESYNFCTNHHCIRKPSDSLFVYDGGRSVTDNSCGIPFPGEIDISQASIEIRNLCNNNTACIFDTMTGGPEAGVQGLQHEETSAQIVMHQGPPPSVTFDLPPVSKDTHSLWKHSTNLMHGSLMKTSCVLIHSPSYPIAPSQSLDEIYAPRMSLL